MNNLNLCGVKIIVQPPMKVTKKTKRTLWERIFSLSPFKKYRESWYYKDALADGQVISDRNGTLIMNQKTYDTIQKQIDKSMAV